MSHTVTLLMTEFVTHDVKRFIVSRPAGFRFEAGQGVELAIDDSEWAEQGRPFTPTSLVDDQVLEFTIKGYPDHDGVTERLHHLRPGAILSMSEPFGTIRYQGAGIFIAGGAGITPFIAVLRERARRGGLDGHRLIFANKTPADIICEQEFRDYLGEGAEFLCSRVGSAGCRQQRIDRNYLSERVQRFDQRFYVCGPPKFVEEVNASLQALGASPDALVFER
ncbi:MAG: FAD-binding oxidoreductase [Gammaproteobacteria bacterium]